MIRMVFIFIFFSLILFGQKDINKIECRIKSLKTTCLGNPKEVISEIKYKAYNSSYSYAKIDRIFGRFEDLQHGLYTRNFQQNRIDFTCNETIRHDQQNEVFYTQQSDDLRKFYFIYSNYMFIYKGTEDIKEIKKININDPKKYLLLYNKDQEIIMIMK